MSEDQEACKVILVRKQLRENLSIDGTSLRPLQSQCLSATTAFEYLALLPVI